MLRNTPFLQAPFPCYLQAMFAIGRRCIIGLSMVLLAPSLRAAHPYSLNERAPIGAFLDGRLPSSVLVQPGKWAVVDAFTNLSFDDPTMLIPEPGTHRLFVSTRQGQIFSFENRPDAS